MNDLREDPDNFIGFGDQSVVLAVEQVGSTAYLEARLSFAYLSKGRARLHAFRDYVTCAFWFLTCDFIPVHPRVQLPLVS